MPEQNEQLEPLLDPREAASASEEDANAAQSAASSQAHKPAAAPSSIAHALTTAATSTAAVGQQLKDGASRVGQFLHDSTAPVVQAVRDNMQQPSSVSAAFPPPPNMPEVPDLYVAWHAPRNLMAALLVVSFLTLLVRFGAGALLPGVFGLMAAVLYFFDTWHSSIVQRAKLVRIFGLFCAIFSALFMMLYGLLLIALISSPSWDEWEEKEMMPNLTTIYVIVLCGLTWFGVLTWLAVGAVRSMQQVLRAGNPVTSGMVAVL